MARNNYQYEKRQKDIAKKKKQDEKRQKRLNKKSDTDIPSENIDETANTDEVVKD
ncbi:MAG: hypothetical protein KA369_14300 [Spirochaetes bacterium]|nr:hypothetical protein [Spirochaetota bacterium]